MRRAGVTALIALVATLVGTMPAHAWSNGSAGSNTFGTHDWVLREAVRAAGPRASWVCMRTALRATDDPDTLDGIDHASGTWWHVFDIWGARWGAAPEAASVWFHRVRRALRAGHPCRASRALGIMSHFVADVAQPMHTDGYLAAEDRVHASYEAAVDARCRASGCRYVMRYDGRDPATPFRRTVRVARLAHERYRDLVRTYDRHGYSPRVDRITRRQLNRAANAVADLITSL